MRKQRTDLHDLASLDIWRLPFNSDMTSRRRRALENRRPRAADAAPKGRGKPRA